MTRPVAPELRRDRMASLRKEVLVVGSDLAERIPITLLCAQAIRAEPPEQHIIRSRVFGMQLEPVTLKPLELDRAPFDLLADLIADWVAKYRQAAVLIPILENPPTDLVASFGEEATVASGRRGRRRRGGLTTTIPIAQLLGQPQVQVAILLARFDM